jgi:uncharacterized protein YacL
MLGDDHLNVILYRFFLVLFLILAGYFAGPKIFSFSDPAGVGAVLGTLLGFVVLLVERAVNRTPPHIMLGGGLGALSGIGVALAFAYMVDLRAYPALLTLAIVVFLGHLGFVIGMRSVRSFKLATAKTGMAAASNPKILDTSAIIDGRIVEMVELGFVGGPLVVPQFVLQELQGIADSTDPLRRARGRRGLGVLEKLNTMEGVEVNVVDEDFLRIKEVDQKIVALAKLKGATIVTTDFNLAKVAELHGIRVMNVNELSQALRPVVLPGEPLRVTIQKEGKEPGQGVGYLEDGTMVVVEEGYARMGESIRAVVTSVLQTSAGRMIFTKAPEDSEEVVDVKERRKVWRRSS